MMLTSTLRSPQAVSSTTFSPPPLDGTLTIPEIYDFHLRQNGSHTLFVYNDVDGGLHHIQWRRAVQAIHAAARVVQSVVGPLNVEGPVISILAVLDQLSYFALTAGIIRAGCRAFPISPRNSSLGVASLLRNMGVRYLFVSKDAAMQKLASAACEGIEENRKIDILEIPNFEALYGASKEASDATFQPLPPVLRRDIDSTVMILHSSGMVLELKKSGGYLLSNYFLCSNSFPKPISITHHNLLQWGSQPYYGESDLCGKVFAGHSLPFFHAMGIITLCWATMTGLTLASFEPCDPPVVLMPDNIYKSAIATQSKIIFCAPTFLEEWSQDPRKVDTLQKFDTVCFGGAPMPKAVGDFLVHRGLNLYSFYGSTEMGGISMFPLKVPPKEEWEYFKMSPHVEPVFRVWEEESSIFELLFRECGSHNLTVKNAQIAGSACYDTNDLLIRHPTNPELWKVYGRSDEQIMHSTTEKTNPVPMEIIINRHPMVHKSLIYGRGRFQAGVLIQPVSEYLFDPSDAHRLAEFRNSIWPSIEEANQFAPSHSRIFKEIILVANPSKPFQFTPKGTLKRQVILDAYKDEIERGYTAIEESSQPDIPLPQTFTLNEILGFVQTTIEKVTARSLNADEDIFQAGCDSLQATWIRNTILNALRQLPNVLIKDIPINFVYLHPTINQLGKYVAQIAERDRLTDGSPVSRMEIIEKMHTLVDKYSQDFREYEITETDTVTTASEIILLTGSTGGLGSYCLENLVLNPTISRVYVFNRKDRLNRTGYKRQRDAFEDRGIDITILDSPKIIFLEGDASLHMLGLDPSIYEELRLNITCVIHNAWRVDFNVTISSLEPLIAGTRRLIDLVLASPRHTPPSFVFTSSIGVARNWTQGIVPEVTIDDPAVAVGSGYCESKWAAETILTLAAERTRFAPVIVRIGQLSGGRNGCWNTSEWAPNIIQASQVLDCLPLVPGHVSWVPIHTAAISLTEMRHSQSGVLHLAHPNPVLWSTIVKYISEMLGVPITPYSTWLSTLEASIDGRYKPTHIAPDNPVVPLLNFFRSVDKSPPLADAEAFGFPRLDTVKAVNASLSLTSASPLERLDAERWLDYWTKVNFIKPVNLSEPCS